ncbi:hypothetical protein J2Z21_000537 [Streptomyces griseochromogenes]|uniref:Uncharacterized protein n=1 Tax=Streptomyces griseochromogenes TaxID=68214 RepID=A0ABS4LJQ3_9ACTN|nr:hypothetical protein [Streptomyces griseochromogenes]MBP2047615.1 hypothetical protein [Streptomyces griseochromogenes]
MRSEKIPGYAAARLYYSVSPTRAGAPEALTRSKAEALRAHVGDHLELRVDSTPFSSQLFGASQRYPYAEATLRLVEAEWSDDLNPQVRGMDGSLFLRFRLDDRRFLQQLIDHRDPDWGPELAFRRRILHWGTQNWGGLTWTLSAGGTHLYCCDVDVFLPEEPEEVTEDLYLFILSFDPVAYEHALSETGGEAEDGRREPDEPVEPAEPDVPVEFVDPGQADEAVDSPLVPATSSASARDEDPHIGRCTDCGTRLRLPSALLTVVEETGGTAILSCTGCRKGQMVRIASASDRRLGGARFEVLTPPDPAYISEALRRAGLDDLAGQDG